MLILHAVETVVPFPSKGYDWKQIPPHEVTAMAAKGEYLPLSPYAMKLCQDGRNKYWKWCSGEKVESGIPYISLTKI
jgi:hypothetical protein